MEHFCIDLDKPVTTTCYKFLGVDPGKIKRLRGQKTSWSEILQLTTCASDPEVLLIVYSYELWYSEYFLH